MSRVLFASLTVCLVPTLEPGQEFDPETLATLAGNAARLTLRRGETKTHNVQIGR